MWNTCTSDSGKGNPSSRQKKKNGHSSSLPSASRLHHFVDSPKLGIVQKPPFVVDKIISDEAYGPNQLGSALLNHLVGHVYQLPRHPDESGGLVAGFALLTSCLFMQVRIGLLAFCDESKCLRCRLRPMMNATRSAPEKPPFKTEPFVR